MKEEKKYNVYVHNNQSYLEAKFSGHIKYIANGKFIGGDSHGQYPDYVKFDCEAENITGYFKQEKKKIEYRLKDKFINLCNAPKTLSLDSKDVDDELYCEHYELVDVEPENLNLNIVNWDCEPAIPRYVDVKKPFKWSVEDKREHSKYPCSISPRNAFNILCQRAKVLIKNNPNIFSNYREFKDCQWYKWISCDKKKTTHSTNHISIEQYYFAKPEHKIEGNNLNDCLKNLELYISHGLGVFTDNITGDYIKSVQLEYGEKYKVINDDYIAIKLDNRELDLLKKLCNLSKHKVFVRYFSKSKLGKSIVSMLNVLENRINSKPTFEIKNI